MKFLNTLNQASASFAGKEHSTSLGNSGECRMYSHIHPSAELLFVLSGEMTIDILGKGAEKIPAGHCAFILPFQSHSYYRPEGTHYFRFNFNPSLVQAFFKPNEKNVGESAVFPVNMEEYANFLNSVRAGQITLYKVKGFLYNIMGDYTANVALVKQCVDESTLNKVITYINNHLGEKLKITDVAAALGYNDKYLSRQISGAAGFGFSTLLTTLRVDAASNLLKNTDMSLVDIAFECGFGSERNFYRSFKEFTGLTPKEYRLSPPRKIVINDAVL